MSIPIVAAYLLSMGVIITSISLWNLSGMSVREIPFLRPRLPDPSEIHEREDYPTAARRILEAKTRRGRRLRARVPR